MKQYLAIWTVLNREHERKRLQKNKLTTESVTLITLSKLSLSKETNSHCGVVTLIIHT